MKKLKVLFLICLLVLCFTTTGCLTAMTSLINNVSDAIAINDFKRNLAKEVEEFGYNPTNSAIVVGSGFSIAKAVQQNPAFKRGFCDSEIGVSPAVGCAKFLYTPIPVGYELKFYETHSFSGDVHYIGYYGIAGVDVATDKPGLYYFNSFDPTNKYEEECWTYALDFYKGSEWESLIVERLEELKK